MPEATVESKAMKVFALDSPEGKALLDDADRRINEAPKELYNDQRKLMVRKGLRSARKLARVTTVYFGSAKTGLDDAESSRLGQAFEHPEVKEMLKNPKTVVFTLGFSDPSGSADFNKKLAMDRAASVAKLVRDGSKIRNEIHQVAIGPTEIISEANKDKNRAVEVWLVAQ